MERCVVSLVLCALIGCADDPSGAPQAANDDGGTSGVDTMADHLLALDEIRAAMRASPSHRVEEAARLIAAGDPDAIFLFVRDRIAARLSNTTAFDREMTWGVDATLRGGIGTPRERLELLGSMLRQAGYETETLVGFVEPDRRDDLVAMLTRAVVLPPPPALSTTDLERWSRLLQTSLTDGDFPTVDQAYADSLALSERLRPLVPEPARPFGLSIGSVRMPYLRFRRPGGEWTFANPNVVGAALGEAIVQGVGAPAREPDEVDETVRVRVWMRTNRGEARGQEISVLERTWNVAEVVGRTATVQFSPLLDFEDLVIQYPEDLDVFLPSLQLAGPADDPETIGALSITGPLVTRGGSQLGLASGAVSVDGDVLATSGAATTTVADSVRHLDVVADASGFPTIEVRFDARAADGALLPGMLAGDFSVSEEGDRVVPLLRANRYRPRVVFVIDNSLSVPREFRDGFDGLVVGLAEVLFERYGARVMANAIGDFDNDNPFVDTIEALRDQLANDVLGNSSFLWNEVAEVSRRGADLVIALTDADNTGPDEVLTPEKARLIRSGSPVLVLGAGNILQSSIDVLSQLTDTRLVPVADVDAAHATALAYIEERRVSYRLRYQAPREGPTTRRVEVALRSEMAAGLATYTVTSTDGADGGIVGLYLEVEHRGKTHKRRLAGIPESADVDDATEADLNAVRGALLGRYALRFEAGFLSPSMLFDEVITEYLANREVLLAHGDFEALAASIDRGIVLPTTEAAFFLATAPPDGATTAPDGIRAVLQSERIDFARDVRLQELDILPFGTWSTVDAQPVDGWQKTFERSLHLAILESELFGESTVSLLNDEELVYVAAERAPDGLDGDLRAQWREAIDAFRFDYGVLMPADGEPVAFYAVNERTGHVVAVISDGAGGTREEEVQAIRDRVALFERIEAGLSAAGIQTGFWVKLEIAKAKVVAEATIAIITLDGWGDGMDPEFDPMGVAESSACGIAEGYARRPILRALSSSFGGRRVAGLPVGTAVSRFNSLLKAILGSGAIPSVCR